MFTNQNLLIAGAIIVVLVAGYVFFLRAETTPPQAGAPTQTQQQ